jgi:hypothetical protein
MAIKVLGNVFTTDKEKKSSGSSDNIDSTLSEKELNFILTKLREANYKGSEFEMFYTVWIKLSNYKPK